MCWTNLTNCATAPASASPLQPMARAMAFTAVSLWASEPQCGLCKLSGVYFNPVVAAMAGNSRQNMPGDAASGFYAGGANGVNASVRTDGQCVIRSTPQV